MKFLLIVLTIRFLAELIGRKRKAKIENTGYNNTIEIRHPAEYELRDNYEWRVEWW